MKFAYDRGELDEAGLGEMIEEMKALPAQVEMALNNRERIQRLSLIHI